MRTPPILAVFSLSFLVFGTSARAEDYQGADAILKQVEAQTTTAKDPSKKQDPVLQWREDLKQYQARAATLTPDEAAREWLGLFDRSTKLPVSRQERFYGNSTPLHAGEALQALPPPAVWDALAAQIAARPAPEKGSPDLTNPVLRIVAGSLQNKPADVAPAIEALKKQTENIDGQLRPFYEQNAQALQQTFLTQTGDKRGALAEFESKLAQLKPDAEPAASENFRQTMRMNTLEVPRLVALVGAARAEALLKEMFTLEVRGIIVRDKPTRALARKVALEMGDKLRFAPWSLVDNLDSVALYEALDKRFPNLADDPSDRRLADAYGLLGLIAAGRYEPATALAEKMANSGGSGRDQEDALGSLPDTALREMAMKGYAKEVYRFFDRLLTDHPELPYWPGYTTAAVLAGEREAMLAKVKAASERTDLRPRTKAALRRAYGAALLAADHVAEALPILRELAAAKTAGSGNGADNESRVRALAIVRLVSLGQLLGDDALVNEQLDAFAALAKEKPELISNVSNSIIETFLAAKRGPELERLLTAGLLKGTQAVKDTLAKRATEETGNEDYYFRSARLPLFELVDLYDHAGRYEDVVALLDHANLWGVPDLAGILTGSSSYEGRNFPLHAARALQKTGHTEAALRAVNAYLNEHGGSDPGCALLLELLPPDKAEARLNELFQGDQFEERPLIWRASLQLGQGRLDEAEKSARQAISIDPSDGEEGRGDRMRAYAVLGDILERKGDAEKAGQMRQAVQAIRLSEDADKLYAAGLLTRAVALYEKALGFFSDAYCIQSRLAIQLMALGQVDEAMAHYERAYQLMPESFGRMESHCFGCERAFAGERAQGVAERVFQKMADQQPTNPQVHYLLGYLRMEQDRSEEAAREFGEAVKLDPDYINAWKNLANTTLDPAVRDRAELNLLRLDPRQKHDRADLTVVNDLRALWAAVETAMKMIPPPVSSLYPLEGSAAFLKQQRENRPAQPANAVGGPRTHQMPRYSSEEERLTPRAVVLRNKVITQALQLLPRNDLGTFEDF